VSDIKCPACGEDAYVPLPFRGNNRIRVACLSDDCSYSYETGIYDNEHDALDELGRVANVDSLRPGAVIDKKPERKWRQYESLKPGSNPHFSSLGLGGTLEITTKFDAEQQTIIQEEPCIMGKIIQSHMDLREKGIRDALIKAGWTPPIPKSGLLRDDELEVVKKEAKECRERTKLLSKALRAICLTRDYCEPGCHLPAYKGWDWFDVGSELAAAIPHDEWAREFRLRVEIDQKHRSIIDRLRTWLDADDTPPCKTPMVDVVPGFLEASGFTRVERYLLLKGNAVRATDKIMTDDDMAKAFDEYEVPDKNEYMKSHADKLSKMTDSERSEYLNCNFDNPKTTKE